MAVYNRTGLLSLPAQVEKNKQDINVEAKLTVDEMVCPTNDFAPEDLENLSIVEINVTSSFNIVTQLPITFGVNVICAGDTGRYFTPVNSYGYNTITVNALGETIIISKINGNITIDVKY